MSNWHIYHLTGEQKTKRSRRKELAMYFIVSTLLIAAGSWFVFYLLGLRGIHPFKKNAEKTQVGSNSFFSPTVQYWQENILSWAEEWSLDPLLIATVMQIESCGNPQAVSPAGAQGLFQVMPYHFADGEDMLDPQTNAKRGMAYLSQAYESANGDIERTLAGYNGGHGQIHRDPALWLEETKRYVLYGTAIYEDAANGNIGGTALNAWLNAGGASLCQQAKDNLSLD